MDHRRFLVCSHDTINVFGYTREFKVSASVDHTQQSQPVLQDQEVPVMIIEHNINNAHSDQDEERNNPTEDYEEIVFANFLSDFDPSLILVMSYCAGRKCTYMKLLKIYNQSEQEEDLRLRQQQEQEQGTDNNPKSYSMAEDEAKRKLI